MISNAKQPFNKSVKRICDKMEEHEDHMTTEIMELEEHLQSNFTNQLEHSYGYITSPPCDGTGGWRRAVYLDMTGPNTNCPEGPMLHVCTRSSGTG